MSSPRRATRASARPSSTMANARLMPRPAPTALRRPVSSMGSRSRKAAGPGSAATAARAGQQEQTAARSKRTGPAGSHERLAYQTLHSTRRVSGGQTDHFLQQIEVDRHNFATATFIDIQA